MERVHGQGEMEDKVTVESPVPLVREGNTVETVILGRFETGDGWV